MVTDKPDSIHAFNRFEEEGHAERKYNHFRLIGLTREDCVPWKYRPSLMMSRNEFFCVSGDRYKKIFWPKRTVLFSKPEEKNNDINIIAKNNEEEEYPYISIWGPHGYRRHKVRLLVIRNQGSTLFADGDTSNAFVPYNIWREHGLIIVDPKRPKQFRLVMINQEQLFALNDM